MSAYTPKMAPKPTDLLTAAEVATLHGRPLRTVQNALADGSLPGRLFGRMWLVVRRDANRWEPRPVGWKKGRSRKAPAAPL